MMTRTVVALLLFPVAAAVPLPGANDAGSGTDAGDVALLALPITPGGYDGTLSAADPSDHFALSPPGTSIVRLRIESDAVVGVTLRDPEGTVRFSTLTYFGEAFGDSIGQPEGTWDLEVYIGANTFLVLPYRFSLAFEEHEHVALLETPADNVHALRVAMERGEFAAVDLRIEAAGPYAPFSDAFGDVFLVAVREDPDTPLWFGGGVSFGEAPASLGIALHGVLPEDIGARVDLPIPPVVVGAGRVWFENPGGFREFDLGYAASILHVFRGWVLWDGQGFSAAFVRDSWSRFARVVDFEDGGPAVMAGPYLHADARTTTLPHAKSPVVFVDARSPSFATSPTRFNVAPPEGSPFLLAGETWLSTPLDARGGPWGIDAMHVDGLEGSRFRVIAAGFPFPWP